MQKYIIRRLIQAVPLLFGVTVVAFVIVQAIPGGALGAYGVESGATGEDLARLEEQLGLNKPLHEQYFTWMGRFLLGDWGRTLITRVPVDQLIAEAFSRTILLISASVLIGLSLGITFGVISAVRRYSAIDMLVTTVSFVGLSVPVFWSGLVLILIFSVRLNWLPGGGMFTPGQPYSLLDRLEHMILPVAALSFPIAGEYTRYVRSSLLDTLGQDYVLTAYSKGLRFRTVLLRHALRNSLIPLVTILALQLPWMVSGLVVTESIFTWPGMGRLLWTAALQHDYPMMMAITVLVAVAVLSFNLLADIVYALLDPRIAYE